MQKQDRVDYEKLEALRKANHLNIKDMATYLGYRTPTGYWQLEKGMRQITATQIFLIAKKFNCTIEELFTESE